jgi:hypothetical protein
MNNLPMWKLKIIEWLAGKEPVLLNFIVLCKNLPSNMTAVVMIPSFTDQKPIEFYEDKAFLVPKKNISA